MVQIRMLSDEWLSRYELLENLKIKLCRRVTGTRTQPTRVTAIALLVLCTGELKNIYIFIISSAHILINSPLTSLPPCLRS